MNSIMRKSVVLILAALMVAGIAVMTQEQAHAASKPWYGRYWELSKTARKVVKIKGNKIYLKGKWERKATRYDIVKAKKIKKTFKLTKKTKYFFEYEDSDKAKRVSKKKFKKYLYSDVTYCDLKVKKGKVIKAYLSFN